MTSTADELTVLVCKRGVALGGLTPPQRNLALGVAAAALADGRSFSEAEVNACLKAALSGTCRFLDTDHVELRRWLVDGGWWQRDGYGRAYARRPLQALPADLRDLARELEALDLPTWVAARQAERETARQARREAWRTRQEQVPDA